MFPPHTSGGCPFCSGSVFGPSQSSEAPVPDSWHRFAGCRPGPCPLQGPRLLFLFLLLQPGLSPYPGLRPCSVVPALGLWVNIHSMSAAQSSLICSLGAGSMAVSRGTGCGASPQAETRGSPGQERRRGRQHGHPRSTWTSTGQGSEGTLTPAWLALGEEAPYPWQGSFTHPSAPRSGLRPLPEALHPEIPKAQAIMATDTERWSFLSRCGVQAKRPRGQRPC